MENDYLVIFIKVCLYPFCFSPLTLFSWVVGFFSLLIGGNSLYVMNISPCIYPAQISVSNLLLNILPY